MAVIPLSELIAADANIILPVIGSNDWDGITVAEQEVFGIEIDRMPLMIAVYQAYEAFKDMAVNHWVIEHNAAIEAAKIDHPDLAAQEFGERGWQDFAIKFSNLTMCEAWQWWAKFDANLARQGLINFRDGSKI